MEAKSDGPKIEWNGKEFFVTLSVEGRVLEAKWEPTTISVVRVREVGTEEWSPGFVTPLNAVTILDLKPNTEYEMKLTHKNAHGEGPPAFATARTNAAGKMDPGA